MARGGADHQLPGRREPEEDPLLQVMSGGTGVPGVSAKEGDEEVVMIGEGPFSLIQ